MMRIPRYIRRTFLHPRPFVVILTIFLLLDALIITSFRPLPVRTASLPPQLKTEKIFIASINRNSEYMLRLYWSRALLALCSALGPSNVYVSILESGSQEDTKGALRDLEAKLNELGVENRIELGQDVYEQFEELQAVPGPDEDRTGWIFTGRGPKGWEVRRIPYLAALRNRAMQPLLEMKSKRKFDRVLWINDVVFRTEDVMTLLSTRNGDYAAACALDFSRDPEAYYDTFALRDSSGLKTATQSYPYFHSSPSLRALTALSPIPVQSCWNGLISFTATPFYDSPPLTFRGIPDTLAKEHLEGSECCLIHADNSLLRSQKGNWINPNVRVAYNASTYSAVNGGVEIRSEIADLVDGVNGEFGDGRPWPGRWEVVKGVWRNRYVRWVGWVRLWSEARVVKTRLQRWVEKGKNMMPPEERREIGVECLVNEMQILFENGWQHV